LGRELEQGCDRLLAAWDSHQSYCGQMQTLNFLKNMERLMQKWEYKIVTVNSKKDFRTGLVSADAIEEELNIHGQQGWELSAAEGVTLHPGIFPVLIFKRAL